MRFSLKLGTMKLGAVRLGTVAMAAVIAVSAAAMWAVPAWAQGEEESAGHLTVREEVHEAGLKAAAEVLGMTPEELSDQLWAGKTLAGLAEEGNVPLSEVRAAVEEATRAARQERIKEFIAKQVENGRISQAQADWLNQGIDNGWFGRLRRFAGRFDGFGNDGPGFGRVLNGLHAQP
jgi:hypothetical protein